MNWSKIKTFMIVLLGFANLFFLYNIIVQYKSINIISDEVIVNTVEMLKKSNINILKENIPVKKINMEIFEGEFTEEYYENIAKQLSGANSCTKYNTPTSIKIITNNSDTSDIFEFYGDFGIKYINNGVNNLNELQTYIDNYILNSDKNIYQNLEKVAINKLNRLNNIMENFLYKNNESKSTISAKQYEINTDVEYAFYDVKNDYFIVKYNQSLKNIPLYNYSVLCIIKKNDVLFMDGKLFLSHLTNKYQSTLHDQINILFSEKKHIIEEKYLEEQISKEMESTTKIPSNNNDYYTITNIKSGYCIYWHRERTNFYFIPAWIIEYQDGEKAAYNAVSGKRI